MAAKFLLAGTCVPGAHSSGWVSDSCHTFLPHPALPHHSFTAPSRPSLPQHSIIYTSPSPPHPPPMNSSVTGDIFVAAILAAICSAFSALALVQRAQYRYCKMAASERYIGDRDISVRRRGYDVRIM